jgi:hypothetical protein
MIKEISQADYESTMAESMINVTETAEPVVDIWLYVELLVQENIVASYVWENNLVEKVYRSKDNRYDHVLLPTARENYFIVLLIDINAKPL